MSELSHLREQKPGLILEEIAWVQIPALSITGCVILSKLITFWFDLL